ncbi:hypothetical protein A8B77_02800 [Erythrobacter sp. EhN03]|uniref:phage head closure protein n=1 Tax=Qipengyuania flava TaxID=192812 RepID=UPI0007F53F28|nr:hypothetical protein A8B77_02800 [Erythrobacter sp. EhN03]
MNAGALDRRVTIQRELVTGENDYGEQITETVDVATVPADVRQMSGREFFAAAAVTAESRVLFRLRYIEGVSVTDSVLYDGRDHNIQEVKELGRREGLELMTVALAY